MYPQAMAGHFTAKRPWGKAEGAGPSPERSPSAHAGPGADMASAQPSLLQIAQHPNGTRQLSNAALQQAPHVACHVTAKETCPRQQCASFQAPRPVRAVCRPACAVYHDVGQRLTFCRRERSAMLPTLSRDAVDGVRPGAAQPSGTSASRLPCSTAGPGPRPRLGGVPSPSAGKTGRSGPTSRTTGPSAHPLPRFMTPTP